MKLSDMRIKTKLMGGFTAMAAIVALVSALALHALGDSNSRFTGYLDGVATRERLATAIRGAAQSRAIAARNLVLVTSQTDRDVEQAAVTQAQESMNKAMTRLGIAIETDSKATQRDRDLLSELRAVEASYGPLAAKIIALALTGQRENAVALMNADCRPLLASLIKSADAFISYDQDMAVEATQTAGAAFTLERRLLWVASLLAAAAALALGFLLSNSIIRPLNRAVTLAEAVAAGDLRSSIAVDSTNETGQLLAALKRMTDNLSAMVGSVRVSADGIAVASREIASGNQNLSDRTEQQASALQQTASSMQQMTTTVQRNADSSRQANELSGLAAQVAGQGGAVVDRVIATMAGISSSSKKIADIIGVIDGIAFQTNILALNAAVEAARAGGQGKGFAVVASEVRGLAQRAAGAAREIKTLIDESVEKVAAGTTLVAEAGKTMSDIVVQVRRVTSLIAEIDASTASQGSGILQVNEAVSSMDRGTQQNAALVEQSAAASESLSQQAMALLQVIGRFKTALQGPALAARAPQND